MPSDEKRRFGRKLVTLSASVTRDYAGWNSSDVEVQTLNLSRTGALIETREPLLTGEQCTFTLAKPNGGYGDIPARIVWMEKKPEGGYRAGVAFRNLSPDEEYLVDLHLVRSAK